ncbi:transient receptor potential cation channel subfamily A member 1-like isoform X2 [Dreissena polymorpha]|uniref:transient receptor potential cation channel subfamily A member 1-like isoform X2 n=1 Tax=Dreissena polymorpha TaxID=45954 RepID=UPI002264576B|nr:transient receptor potential cation channel subfamily A member 1-like isoform X2 [Dreissena polymorpha]
MEGKEHRKKIRKGSRVGVVNDSFELVEEASNTVKQKVSPFLNNIRDVQSKNNNAKSRALENLVNAKKQISKWKEYVNRKRLKIKSSLPHEYMRRITGKVDGKEADQEDKGILGLAEIHDDYLSGKNKVFGKDKLASTMFSESNRTLMSYFTRLGRSTKQNETIDLMYVADLFEKGASVNCTDTFGQSLLHEVILIDLMYIADLFEKGASVKCTDTFGQSLLHEVASKWHVDVACFLIENGADVNLADHYGRTPLHVAAGDNYPDMVNLLIDNGARREAQTLGELQTPVHFAARNDATDSLKVLIKRGCQYKEVRDYKGRTPLHIAAQLDRSETARLLLELEAPVGLTDNKGQSIINWMITKMPPVALDALQQLLVRDRPNRKQYFYLNALVNDVEKDQDLTVQLPLQVAVKYRQFDILTNQVFLMLIEKMWLQFGRWRAYGALLFNFMYIMLWTIYGVFIEYDERHDYKLPEHWWRIVLIIAAVGITVWQIIDEIREYRRLQVTHENVKKWLEQEINDDMKYCHPRWPEEKAFLETELGNVHHSVTSYFADPWNWFDWMCYSLLLAVIVTHFVDIGFHTEKIARAHIRLTAIVIIFLWLRLMKNIRAFSLLGPFVVMLGAMIKDLVKFAFLYFEFYIPYLCAFWMIFGGTKRPMTDSGETLKAENVTVTGMGTFDSAMFLMWRMTLVDDYAYDQMLTVDSIMAPILVGTWLFLSAVVCLNLLIALFSDTFQRVYDNAKANAVMQKCIMLLAFWEGMSPESCNQFLTFIRVNCSPFKDDYDDDMTDPEGKDLQKVTIQIKTCTERNREELDEMKRRWHDQFGDDDDKTALEELYEEDQQQPQPQEKKNKMVTTEKFQGELDILRDQVAKGLTALEEKQTHMMNQFKRDMKMVKSLLLNLSNGGQEGQQGGQGGMPYGGPWRPQSVRGMRELEDLQELEEPQRRESTQSAGKRKKKGMVVSEESSVLEPMLPEEMAAKSIFAPSPAFVQPEVEVSTHEFYVHDPYSNEVISSGRSSSRGMDFSIA